ncbi:MAG: acetoacetate decarboxylase family protein [Actinobacteria bacterium]|nr:acetoacetate decarboxylase family protein [Actinomycetota bacterium]
MRPGTESAMTGSGRLSPGQFGFTGPVSAPNIDPPPHFYRGTELATFDFETDAAAAAALLPEELSLAHEPARARIVFADFPFSTLGVYREAMLQLACTFEGRRVFYCPGDIGLIAGREIWGAPKLLGSVGFEKRGPTVSCHVERAGTRIASAELRPRNLIEPGATVPPLVFLKVIPSPEAGAPPEVCELVEVDLDSTVHLGSDGTAELFTGPAELRLERSAVDPWAALPILRTLRGTYGRFDSVLNSGRVLHRYADSVTQLVGPQR